MNPATISTVRYGILATVFVFSLIVLGLSGHLVSLFTGGLVIPNFIGFALATSVLTMVAIGVSIGIDLFRKNAFTSMVATELGWTFFLMILWIASAGDSTSLEGGIACNNIVTLDVLGNIDPNNVFQQLCQDSQALIAFSWLNFLLMFGWHVALIVFTVTAVTRGQTSVWTSPVQGTDYFKRTNQASYGGGQQQQQFSGAPVQEQQYTGGAMQQTYPPAGYNTTPAPGVAQV